MGARCSRKVSCGNVDVPIRWCLCVIAVGG